VTAPDTDLADLVRRLRDDLVRAQAAARIAERRVDELEAAVASSADAVAERDLIRDRVVETDALAARAETAERRLAAIYASRLWRTGQAYGRVAGRLRRP
jgi:hypothetical protein